MRYSLVGMVTDRLGIFTCVTPAGATLLLWGLVVNKGTQPVVTCPMAQGLFEDGMVVIHAIESMLQARRTVHQVEGYLEGEKYARKQRE